jgi:transketolase
MKLPEINSPLQEDHIKFLEIFAKSCRKSAIEMVVNAQSGHPGGALSSIDYLATLYSFIIGQTGEKLVVSNGHISPAVYAILAEMGYIPKEDAVKTFRKIDSIYEGHITRHVPGIEYGTGPLGIGVSVASGFAWGEKYKDKLKESSKVFFTVGDGECQEGQVHEMINFAKQHKLNNLIGFIDYNKVQLTASLKETLDIDVIKMFQGADWKIIEINAHDFQDIWKGLSEAYSSTEEKPIVLIGHSIMGQGSKFMQPAGESHNPEWHGKAPKPEEIEEDLKALTPTEEENEILQNFRQTKVNWHPKKNNYPELLSPLNVNIGYPLTYESSESIDCRSAYGKTLLDLAKRNPQIIALTADLKGSVMTKFVSEELPNQYIECGITEQHMISTAGGLSLDEFVPFASTFGAFITSRAKDQARVNDINHTNVKMVATHCGLSVGEDGPTHQAIDDMSSFLGFYNTMIIEPADPNQTDHIIRYIASHYGNFYVRMGRHKFPIITKEDGSPFYDKFYEYEYGKSDIIRQGENITIAASGAMIHESLKARELIKERYPQISIEIIAVSSIAKFDETLLNSIKKTGKVLTVEDHNVNCGLGNQLSAHLQELQIPTQIFKKIGVKEYQLSGKADELYAKNGMDGEGIKKNILEMI